MTTRLLFFAALALSYTSAAAAQSNAARWGVSVLAVPSFEFPDGLARVGEFEETLAGTEFGVGIMRARPDGGDWGLSIVQKSVRDGARVMRAETCVVGTGGEPVCARETWFELQDASLLSVQLHRYWAMLRIGRVHLGLEGAIGAMQARGNAIEHVEHAEMRAGVLVRADETRTTTFNFALSDDIMSIYPVLGLEPQLSMRIGNNGRVRVGGGVSLPVVRLPSITLQYLF